MKNNTQRNPKKRFIKTHITGLFLLSSMIVALFFHNTINLYAEEYTYDVLNRVTKVTYDDGSYVEYEYDKNGNILSVNVYNAKPSETAPPEETQKPEETSRPEETPAPEGDNNGDSESPDQTVDSTVEEEIREAVEQVIETVKELAKAISQWLRSWFW